MKKIKILFFHQDGLLTGSAISLMMLLKGLDKNRFDTKVVLAQNGELKTFLEKEGYSVDILNIHGFWTAPGPDWNNKGILINLLALIPNKDIKEYVKIINPDIVHINDKAMLCAGITLKNSRIPVIQHLRSTYKVTNLKFFASLSKYYIKRYSDYLISISKDELKDFNNFPRSSVIYNSVDFENIVLSKNEKTNIRNEFNISKDEKLISYIGPFTKTKGAFDFAEMIRELKNDVGFSKMKFLMAGKINPGSKTFKELTGMINAYEIKEKIIFPGYRKDILNIMGISDIIVNCNRLGASGRQTIEGMSLGIPVIATGGENEIIKNRKTGITVKGARPDLLAQAVSELFQSKDLYNNIAINAQNFAKENFDYRKNAEKIEKIYCSLVNDK